MTQKANQAPATDEAPETDAREQGPETPDAPEDEAQTEADAEAPEVDEAAPEDEGEAEDKPGVIPETPPVESREQAKAILECLLFMATEPLTIRRIQKILWTYKSPEIKELVEEYERDCEGRGLAVREVAGGYQLVTRPEHAEWVAALQKRHKRRGLTRAMLETLAIVAYRQPIVKAEVDAIRGVDSGGILRNLLDMDLIDARDRREVVGRPQQYRTTKAFLKSFGLRSLADLPTIRDLRDLYEESGSADEDADEAETPSDNESVETEAAEEPDAPPEEPPDEGPEPQ